LVENGQVLGTVENVGAQDLMCPEVRESLVHAIENLMAIDVEFSLIEAA